MRNIYIYMLVMLFSSCFYMCDVSNSKNESTDFVIEIEHLPKIQSIKYGDTKYFKSSKIVKLEALDENLIGGIIQIELYDNRFYILDKYSYRSNLYVFDLAGNYLNKIGARGEGPEEYLNISSFFIDEEKGLINIVDGLSSTIIQYDKEGVFIDKIRHNNLHLNLVTKTKVIGNNLFCYSGTNWEGNNMYFVVNKKDYSIMEYLRRYSGEYTNHFMVNIGTHPFTYIDGEFHFGALFTDTIFSFRNDTIAPYMIAKSKENISPYELQGELEKDEYNYGKTIVRIAEKKKYNTGIVNYFENKRYILYDFIAEKDLSNAVLWDKKENEGVLISNYTQSCNPDLSSFISSSGNFVIQIWNNKTIQMFKDKIAENKMEAINYPSGMIEQIRDYNAEEDNPFLILHEFKDN